MMMNLYRRALIWRCLLVLLILLSCISAGYAQKVALGYIDKHAPLAKKLMSESGIPASVILGISMVESAMGTSRNCKLLKNYFGVKGANKLHLAPGGHRSAYRQYPSAEASFRHFIQIVKAKKWFEQMKGKKDYQLWLHKLNHSGYAQAKGQWIADVSSMVRRYDLAQYDKTEFFYFDDTLPVDTTEAGKEYGGE